ncbi:hydrogen gas-evolving membrane-bound hydrogenase subunit E [Aquihabitans daechungensis]|uniref:hydrogen gas-evolving membrane-bound hydrogenase subunit E n=1 Tax=Aquihabitans daechungensis TaxID=1052257 RepID=UPI003BA2F138
MILFLLTFGLVGLALIAFGSRLGRNAFVVAAVPTGAAAAWVALQVGALADSPPVTARVVWVRQLGLVLDLRLDGFAATMSLIITTVGVLVFVYARSYFARDAADLGRLAGLLTLFAGSMLGLVQADNLLFLYICWELTSVTSFLLIGNRHTEPRARAAALHALLVTSAGGLAMLGGFVVLAQQAGTYDLGRILSSPPSGTAVTVAMALILVGALTKSAQYPFHAWLPGAMAAPTPVSAYLHSATMVTAGVFLVGRFAPAFAAVPVWRPMTITAGCCTLVFGGLRALRQHDLKLLLAFGTVSQLGLLMILFGAGTPATVTAGWDLLIVHAAFKAALFMIVGIIDHQTGTRDIRRMPPLQPGWGWVQVTAALALLSMAGVPLGAGFIAKELAYDALAEGGFAGSMLVLGIVVVGSMLTVAYAARFYWGAFVRPRRVDAPPASDRAPTPSPPVPSWSMLAPPAILAVAGVVLGLAPWLLDSLVTATLRGFRFQAPAVHLELWHGFGLPLALSVVTLAGGALLFWADRWIAPVLALGSRVPSGGDVYLAILRRVGTISSRVTRVVQNGSLPVYLGVIILTAAVLPAGALLSGWDWPGWPPLGPARDLPVVAVLLTAALGAAIVRERFSAALLLGVAGYAMAGLFMLSGAPDLALTQVTVETLSTVVFVLVLRRLPERFERQSSPRRRIGRVLIAAAVSITVFVFSLISAGVRLTPPVSDEMVARAVPDGHGRNVVNVILVDFRGFDTLGEITVLAVASIGAVALARVGRRRAAEQGEERPTVSSQLRRLPFVDVSVRIVFQAVVLISVWLLFAGHNLPGGGFVGGLLAGSAITLRYISGGITEVRGRSRLRPWIVLGFGLVLAVGTALAPLLAGGPVLEASIATFDLPVIGPVKAGTTLVFDSGVYLVVLGMVLMAFEAFGDPPAEATT